MRLNVGQGEWEQTEVRGLWGMDGEEIEQGLGPRRRAGGQSGGDVPTKVQTAMLNNHVYALVALISVASAAFFLTAGAFG